MSKNTPGPWRVGTPGPNGCYTIGTDKGLMTAMIAHSVNDPGQEMEAKGNAALIASAPDLLKALEGMVEYVDRMHAIGHIQRPVQSSNACAVIARAKGNHP